MAMAIERATELVEVEEAAAPAEAESISFRLSSLPAKPAVDDVVRFRVTEIDEDSDSATAVYDTGEAEETTGIAALTENLP